jgi:pyruvate formate lyase activating enzyme
MARAQLISPLDDGRVRCEACQWRCVLGQGEMGVCRVRQGTGAGIELLNDALISGATVAPIEDQRLWHFFPDTTALAIGSWGYSLPRDQEHGPYATVPADERARRRLDPGRVARFALDRLCRGVVWAYGEPAVAHEYVLQVLQLSRASSRYTALVSSGFMTLDALDAYGPYLHGLLLELRAFDDDAYERLAGVRAWRGILAVAEHAQRRWGCHVEVVTRLYPGVNDDPQQLVALIDWLRDALGAAVPWHVLPGDASSDAATSVQRARQLALAGGLHFVYGPAADQATRCPRCNSLAITRDGNQTRLVGVAEGACSTCGAALNIRRSIFQR